MMQLHLDEISRHVAEGAHAVLILDRAGWHTTGKLDVPDNITPIFLPSRAPELNPVENVWQYLRQNWLSNTVFENYDAIIDAACAAWQKLVAEPRNDHVHRNARLGSRRSAAMTLGMTRGTRYVRAALGLHPQLVAERAWESALWEHHLPEARYVGEVGLDAGPRFYKSLDVQKQVFRTILEQCADAGGKILTIHSVRSVPMVLDMIERHLPRNRGVAVLH